MRRLQMDFQPMIMVGRSLRKVDKSHWTGVQRTVVPVKDATCSVCGFVAEKRSLIHADEVWSFPEPPTVVLTDIRPLCVNCHEAKDYAELLRRVIQGKASASRSLLVIRHYCEVNNCSTDDFDSDFKAAREQCLEIEKRYGWNLTTKPTIDYGQWDRSPKRPRLTDIEKAAVRKLYRDRDDEIVVNDRRLPTFGAAIRYLQSLTLDLRAQQIAAMQDAVNEECESDDPMTERDEGVQFG
jgi:hypothetical protein